MGKLLYSMLCSLDGYTADQNGRFDWALPDEEVHRFVNQRERTVGTSLYGSRMYKVMVYWETVEVTPGDTGPEAEYARLWRAAEKVVFSRTLMGTASERTRLEQQFDPERVRQWKAQSPQDLSISGPSLAGQALEAGLVDEVQLYLFPVVVGGGTKVLPEGWSGSLRLLEDHRFASGVVFVRYEVMKA